MKKKYLLPAFCFFVFSIICLATPFVAVFVTQIEKSTEDFLKLFSLVTWPTFALAAIVLLIIGYIKAKNQKNKQKEDEEWEHKLTTSAGRP